MANSVFSALILAGTLGAASLGVSACKAKPSEKKCREAIENVRLLTSQTQSDVGADPKAAIRSCRANSSKESVECMINAKTEEDLAKCEGELGEETFGVHGMSMICGLFCSALPHAYAAHRGATPS